MPNELLTRPVQQDAAPAITQVLNALTVDVEDYYHVSAFDGIIERSDWKSYESRVVASTNRILDILDEASVRGTFFILGWVAEREPRLVRRIQEAGHEVACHSYWHRLVYEQTPEEFRADLRRAKQVLEDITCLPITAYRAPSFSITRRSLWALDVLIEEGFTHDSSIYPVVHDRYGLPGAPLAPHEMVRAAGKLAEFPPPVVRCAGYPLPCGGGGYLRLYPYMVTRHALRAINNQGRPAAVYLHPWELDPDQPRLRPGRLRAFRHYVNLRHTADRLRQLVKDFAFGTLSDAFHAYQDRQGIEANDLR